MYGSGVTSRVRSKALLFLNTFESLCSTARIQLSVILLVHSIQLCNSPKVGLWLPLDVRIDFLGIAFEEPRQESRVGWRVSWITYSRVESLSHSNTIWHWELCLTIRDGGVPPCEGDHSVSLLCSRSLLYIVWTWYFFSPPIRIGWFHCHTHLTVIRKEEERKKK
jgi:hypothetical protein